MQPCEPTGSRDGSGAGGDHNVPFEFGQHLTTEAHMPFSLVVFGRLMLLRGTRVSSAPLTPLPALPAPVTIPGD